MTSESRLRRVMHGLLRDVPSSPAPVEEIIRRGRRTRLRRAGAAVGGLGLAGVVAVSALVLPGRPHQVSYRSPLVGTMANRAAPGGVFASGVADGHAWRLAVQDIADPGYSCLPAVVLNGTDADPVYPAPQNADSESAAAVALGPAAPGIGFAFVQLPADIGGVTVNGEYSLPAVTVATCGFRYHLVGFAYSLTKALRLTPAGAPPGAPAHSVVPSPLVSPPAATPGFAQTEGIWNNVGSVSAETAQGDLAMGGASSQSWVIRLNLGPGGDCYEFTAPQTGPAYQVGACGPVSTPTGPETIMAMPLLAPAFPGTGLTAYALQVSPATARLRAALSDGSSEPTELCVVDGRTYAAFVVPSSLRLSRLTWLDAAGRVMASTTRLPVYGYVQFQP